MLSAGQEKIAGIKLNPGQLSVALAVRREGLITVANVERAFPGRNIRADKLEAINRDLGSRLAAVSVVSAITPGNFRNFRGYNNLAQLIDAVNQDVIQPGMRIECTVSAFGMTRKVSGLIEKINKVPAGSTATQWILTIRTDTTQDQATITNDPNANELSDVKIYRQIK